MNAGNGSGQRLNRGASILVVEDERVVASDLRLRLESAGYSVCAMISSGEEAVEKAGELRPDLVLMDITLRGEIDGIMAAELIRRRFDLPVVFLTAHSDEGTLQRAKITEAFGYILKPFEERELYANIEMALYKHATDRRLRESEDRFRAAFDSAPVGIALLSTDGIVERVNSAWCEIIESTPDDQVGNSYSEILHPEDRSAVQQGVVRIVAGESSAFRKEIRCLSRSGRTIWAHLSVGMVKGARDGVPHFIIQIQDVSETLRLDRELKESRHFIESIAGASPDVMFVYDLVQGRSLYSNKTLSGSLGYESESVDNGWFASHLHPEDHASFGATVQRGRQARDGEVMETEFRVQDVTGEWKWIRTRFTPFARGEDGQVREVIGMAMDVTESRQKEDLESAIYRIAEVSLTAESLSSLYRAVHEIIGGLMNAENFYIALYDEQKDVLSFPYFVDTEDPEWPEAKKPGKGLTEYVLRTGKSLLATPEVFEDLVARGEAEMIGAPSIDWLGVPLVRGGKTIGVLTVQTYMAGVRYGDREERILSFVSSQVAMAIERKQAEQQLRTLSSAVEQSESGVVIMDRQGRILYVNPKFTRITGYAAPDAVGGTMEILQSDLRNRDFHEAHERTILSGGSWRGEVRSRRKNGEEYWEAVAVAPIRDHRGAITNYVAVTEDISERKRAEEELARQTRRLVEAKAKAEEQARMLKAQAEELAVAREEALQALRFKSEFVANMSHEIRTPMNGVIGMTGLLLDSPLTPEQREYTEIIRTSGEALLGLINDILDFSKIEAGKLSLEPIDFNLRVAVEEVVDLLAPQAFGKGLEFVCSFASGMPVNLRGDPGRLRQILLNLIGNAIKFTEKGEVSVSVHPVEQSESEMLIRFVIKDTGIGISNEGQKVLFRSFAQADGSTTRRYGGTGLGLAISRQLVELMGGDIGFDTEVGTGSEFWFTAWLHKQAIQEDPFALGDPLRAVRVLIVDDNETNRRILAHMSSSWGMRNTAVPDGETALRRLREGIREADPYTVAILDGQMPEMDGIDLAAAIKADPAIAGTRLLMLTSMGKEGAARAKGRGIERVLTKPVKQSSLLDALITLIGPALLGGSSVPESEDEVRPEEQPTRGLRVLVAEDNSVNQKVALRMLTKLGCRADVVANGLEAIEALKAIPYDLVLLDCNMPEMDGFEAARRIRNLGGTLAGTVVIAMTANALDGDRERCLAAGMDDYIAKPVIQSELAGKIARWVRKSGPLRPLSERGNGGTVGTPVLDPQRMDELAALQDSPGWLAHLAEEYLRDGRRRIAALRSARHAGNAVSLEREAHSLKGSSRNVGAHRIGELCDRLQRLGHAGTTEGVDEILSQLDRELQHVEEELQQVWMIPVAKR